MFFNKKLAFFYLMFAFSVCYFVTAVNLGSPISGNRLEPSFFPLVLGCLAVLFSAILLLREISTNKIQINSTEKETTKADKPNLDKTKYAPLFIMVSIFTYIFSFSLIGYFISSFLFVLSIILIFSSLEKILQKVSISIIIVFVGYLMFEQVFGVRLPTLWG